MKQESTPLVLMKLDEDGVKLAVVARDREILRATLPLSPCGEDGEFPLASLLRSLSLCLRRHLRVVLDAADPVDGFSQALIAAGGTGLRTRQFDVMLVPSVTFLPLDDDFSDVHTLSLYDDWRGP